MPDTILRPGDDRDILAAKFEVEKKDTFHLKNLYEWMHDWLEENDWEDAALGQEKYEIHYLEERHQDGSREYRSWWRAVKQPIDNEYFRYVLVIDWQPTGFNKVQVVHEGEKVSTWQGDLTFHIEAWLQLDYNNAWVNHWLLSNFEQVYRQRIWKEQKDKWKHELWNESYSLAGWIKRYLDMKVPHEMPESFHPEGGVGPTPRS
jgi:hypothetical protein